MAQENNAENKDHFLTAGQAAKIFYELADAPEIPFYAPLGCVERAQDMLNHIGASYPNLPLERVAVSAAPRGTPYRPENLPLIEKTLGWWFHVAPLVPVMNENGEVCPLVFDPALFDGPARIKQWKKRIGAAGREVTRAPQHMELSMPGVQKKQDFSVRPGTAGAIYKILRERFGDVASRGVERSLFLHRHFGQSSSPVNLRTRGRTWHIIKKPHC